MADQPYDPATESAAAHHLAQAEEARQAAEDAARQAEEIRQQHAQ